MSGRADTGRVGMILHNSVDDVNYRHNLRRLTDDELRYCLAHETRKMGARQLQTEARRRGWKFIGGTILKQLTMDDIDEELTP